MLNGKNKNLRWQNEAKCILITKNVKVYIQLLKRFPGYHKKKKMKQHIKTISKINS